MNLGMASTILIKNYSYRNRPATDRTIFDKLLPHFREIDICRKKGTAIWALYLHSFRNMHIEPPFIR